MCSSDLSYYLFIFFFKQKTAYEIKECDWSSDVCSSDLDIGAPNFFVHLDETICSKKIGILMKNHQTQGDKDWFTPDTFLSVMRLRGVEGRAPGRYAEAFHVRKLSY